MFLRAKGLVAGTYRRPHPDVGLHLEAIGTIGEQMAAELRSRYSTGG
jgi:hypothetical protein